MTTSSENKWELVPFNPKNFTELVDFIAEYGRIEIATQFNDWAPEDDKSVSAHQVRKMIETAKTEAEKRWAWCCVHVSIYFFDGYKGTASLGGCSFRNVESFRNSWQFEKLIKEAAEDCARSMWTAAKKIVAICEGR